MGTNGASSVSAASIVCGATPLVPCAKQKKKTKKKQEKWREERNKNGIGKKREGMKETGKEKEGRNKRQTKMSSNDETGKNNDKDDI
jgi:hypothetical protein